MLRFWQKSDAFVSWAKQNAVPLSLDEQNGAMEKLSVLDNVLRDKRIVYLGEEDHWVHEKTDYRMLMLRYLVSRGFRTIGEELGLSDGYRINRYIQTGDESTLSKIATYGYEGDVRQDRDNSPKGVFAAPAHRYPVAAFCSEQLRLARFLRQANEALGENEKLYYFGFDINAVPEGGCADAQELLKLGGDSPVILRLLEDLSPVHGESMDEETARLFRVLVDAKSKKETLLNLLGAQSLDMAERSIQNVIDSLRFRQMTDGAATYAATNNAMADREKVLQHQVEYELHSMKPQDKLVLMAHNRHLSKDFGAINNPGAAPPGGKSRLSIGTYLAHAYPNHVFGIWMLFARGQSSQPYPDLSKTYVPSPKSLNALLEKVGDTFLLPFLRMDRASMLQKSTQIMGLYNIPFKASVASQTDAIFFTRNVSELQP